MGGLVPTLGGAPTAGLLATGGGGPGLGFAANGGGFGAATLPGLEVVGVLLCDESAADAVLFHGAADPFEGAIPGKTATGFADGSAETDLSPALSAAGAAGGAGVARLAAGGGGGGGGGAAAFGLGGTSSR